ncbi:ephrin domain-containing protein [Ditylenchus destructor]|uniref:Ephrin domain-containing protein n=1 Tax=Ditylenchus destructor TaxID=166010 RepID=A0AAD4RCT6_9BILA|nr:ephrin domain-containing protein [Ditylenchus destructor]
MDTNHPEFTFDEYDPRRYFMAIAVNEHDIMYFVCPTAANRSEPSSDEDKSMEYLIVHMVSEMSFLTCQLDSNAIPFLACNDSQQHASNRRRKKVIFRQFSPTPDAMVFSPGTSYYFIATSNGSLAGLWNTQRGLCANKNMRLKIDFEPNNHTNDLEYLIEERAEFPVQQTTTNYDSHFVEEIADNHVNLADIFHINPEYLEFVRNHAVRGGTGEIRFPSDGQLIDDPNTGKRPRFISRNSMRKYNSNNRAQEARIKLETTSREPDSDSVISYSNDIQERNEYISFTGM